jgi:hypothetical protein
MFGMFGVVLNTMPEVSTPSASTRAPPPPPKWLISVGGEAKAVLARAGEDRRHRRPDQFAIARLACRSEASRAPDSAR